MPFAHTSLNAIETKFYHGNAPAIATTASRRGHDSWGLREGGTGSWQGMSIDYLSLIRDRFTMPTTLNKVEEKSKNVTVLEASGSDFSHIVMLDFAQDVTLGRKDWGGHAPPSCPFKVAGH